MSASMTTPREYPTHASETNRATGAALAARRLAIQQPIWRLAVLTQIAPHTLSRIEKGRRRISPAELAALEAALTSLEHALAPREATGAR